MSARCASSSWDSPNAFRARRMAWPSATLAGSKAYVGDWVGIAPYSAYDGRITTE